MKKLLAFALVAVFATAQATTIQWAWNSSVGVKFNGASIGSNGTGYLLYIGNGSIGDKSLQDYVNMTSNPIATTTTALGKIKTKPTMDDSTAVGNYVSVLSYVNPTDSKTYWNVSSTVYTITQAGIDELLGTGTALPDSSFVFDVTTNTTGNTKTGSVGGGWYAAAAVPEPATGALALAGIALLFKRRKARA